MGCPQVAKVCCKPKPLTQETPKNQEGRTSPAPSQCGQRNPEGLNFISRLRLGDRATTQEGEWPHVCTLFKKNSKGNDEFVGGASLIAPGVLVTAAHKIEDYDPSMLVARCGEWDIKSEQELNLHQDRRIANITMHPIFVGGNRQF